MPSSPEKIPENDTQGLTYDTWWTQRMPDDLRALTPLIYPHITLYGMFKLDMHEWLPLETASPHESRQAGGVKEAVPATLLPVTASFSLGQVLLTKPLTLPAADAAS